MLFSKEVGESLTYKFAQAVSEMRTQGKEIISLGLGEPDFPTPEYVVDAVVDALRNGFTHYSATQGLPELRNKIAENANKEYGASYSMNEVIVLPGIKAAVYFALCSVLEPGDEVIMISPYYVSYPAMVKLAEPSATIRYVKLNTDFQLDKDALKNAVSDKTKCILVNSPHNPTGTVLSKEEVEFVVKLAKEHDFYIISDEVYEKLTYDGVTHTSFGRYSEIRDRLIVCNGFSKSYAMTGWRLGYAIGEKSIIAKMNKLQQHINTNTCTFVQKGACAIFEHEPMHIAPYVAELQDRIDFFDAKINELPFASGVKPQAGFFYFVDISKTNVDSNTFCADLLKKTGIASTPGVAFGADWDHYVRFSFAVSKETLERAAKLLESYACEE